MARRFDRHRLILFCLIALYVLVFARLAFDQHAGMRTHKSDLGQMDQAIWNTSRGRFLESIQDDYLSTRLTDHAEPIFAPLSLVFWLWNDVRALLLLQVLVVALGAWPLYELAVRLLAGRASPDTTTQYSGSAFTSHRTLALALAAAYLLAPQLQSAVLTEFHAIPLAAPLILWAFWAIAAGRWWQFAIATLLLASVKEEAALLAAGLGLWALWRLFRAGRAGGRWDRAILGAVAIVVTSVTWFYIATFIIIPSYGAGVHQVAESTYFQRYGALGDSSIDIVTSLLTQPRLVWQIASEPARVRYLFGLLAPFALLSILGADVLLLSLPVLLANLLSAYPAQYYGEFHYSAPLVPYFAVAAAYGAARLVALASRWPALRQRRRALHLALTVWVLVWALASYGLAGRGLLGGRYDPTPITAHHRLLDRFLAQVPDTAAVSATAAVHPHLSHRRYVYQFPLGLKPGQADWALIDVTTATDVAPGAVRDEVERLLAGEWGVVDAADGYLLLHKGAPAKTVPPAFYDFVRAPGDASTARGPLSLIDIQVDDWRPWRRTQVQTRWQVGANFVPENVRPWLELRTASGKLVYTLADLAPPALVWYPPTQWRPGDLITILTPPLALPRAWGAAVATVHGRNPFEPNDRVPIDDVVASPAFPRSPDGSLALVAAYLRDRQGRLQDSLTALGTDSFSLPQSRKLNEHADRFMGPDGPIRLRARLPQQVPAGEPVDLWLQWPDGIPEGFVPFVHLRQSDDTIAQADGPPQTFIVTAAGLGPLNDWRQLPLPANLAPGARLRVVAGLYRRSDDQRLDVLDVNDQPVANETVLGEVLVSPPLVSDQTCALDPATCASQPLP